MKAFRNSIRALVNDVIENKVELVLGTEINFTHPMWSILMGIEHEKIHLETTSCLIRQLSLTFIKPNFKSIFFQREYKSRLSLEQA